jgi:hypothetical protein
LKTLEFLELCCPHATVPLAPAVVGLRNNANLSDRINARHTLPDKYLNLPQLVNYLFPFVPRNRNL